MTILNVTSPFSGREMAKKALFFLMILFFLEISSGFFCLSASPNRYVEIEMTGPVNEKRALYNFIFPRYRTLHQYIKILEKARDDPEVAGVILHIAHPSLGWAKLQQLRRSIHDFRKTGKTVHAFLSGESLPEYLLACACDEITLVPTGVLMITGIRLEALYFKDLLDKLGIDVDVVAIGKYKTAAEPFTDRTMSESSREMLSSILDDYYEQLTAMLTSDRGLTTGTVHALLDGGPFTAQEAVDAGLVDHLFYKKELYDYIEKGLTRYLDVVRDFGREKPKAPEINIFTLFFPQAPQQKKVTEKLKIALIVATGPIFPGTRGDYPFQEEVIAADDLIQTIRECVESPNVAAIILRVDSPGGSAQASDLIWHAVRTAREEKPLVASLSDVAASGGYYIAMGADKVIAEPGTITGSIGVISGKAVLRDMFDKIGVNVEVISRGKNSGIFSPSAPFSESQRQAVRKISLAVYEEFTAKVKKSRGLSDEELIRAARGRVWTGSQAERLGLVDELGGMEKAMDAARKLAGLHPSRPVDIEIYPRQLGLIEFIQEMLGGGSQFSFYSPQSLTLLPLLHFYPLARQALPCVNLFRQEPTLALMPLCLEVK